MTSSEASGIRPEDEVTRLCAELIRIPSVNAGDNQGPGERAAAEWVMEQLHEVGLDPVLVESSPGRASVMVRIEGADPSLDPAWSSTVTPTSFRPMPPTGRSTRSAPKSATDASGVAARST
jgi:acetylornithine deacetylase/succinyl-diaminopimelate desuccinylase-like protein